MLAELFSQASLMADDVTGISVDSRLVQPGDLFIALAGDPGPRFNPSVRSSADGHDHLADALQRGAVAALVSHRQDVPIPQLDTEDTYSGLWQLGTAARARLSGPVIAVTGSSGKTTAKTFLAAALEAYTPPGSFNNHIGVPLSLANAWQQAPAWVFEVGTSYPGEIEPLTQMVRPDLAILLNVHNAHIENFASRAALVAEKRTIFSTLPEDGLRVVHDELGLSGYRFGEHAGADARVLALSGDNMTLALFGEQMQARVPGGGAHRALTLSACLLAAKLLQFDLAPALDLDHNTVPKGRGNVVTASGVDVVDDSYNANPSSMRAALASFFATPAKGRRYAVLGDMRELGEESAAAHRELLQSLIEQQSLHGIVLVGSALAEAWERLQQENTPEQDAGLPVLAVSAAATADLATTVTNHLQAGDRVLIKGSNRLFWGENFVDQLVERL
jgi:UDP-N-acetylmuramoyl-tripeptide--D-alanyl-D-alanine ligase